MKMLQTAFAGMLLLGSTYVHAQTADEIVNKHIDAIGGATVINSIKSQIIEGDLIFNGTPLTTKVTVLHGVGMRSDASIEGNDITECITTTGGWSFNPLAGMTEAAPMPEERVKSSQGDLYAGGKLFKYKEKGSTVELAGTEDVNGVKAFKLKLKDKDGKETLYFIDPATYYIIKSETTVNMNGQDANLLVVYSNYKKTDIGYVVAFTRVRQVPGGEATNTINKIEFNKEIDPKIFEMPK